MTDGKEVKYKAVCDYGRQPKRDKKTGEIMMKQVKTELTFKTLKEAREARAEAVLIRSAGADARVASSKKFCDAVEDYKRSERYKSFSGSYQDHMVNYMNHMVDFFKDMEADKISVVDMEAYYAYQLESGSLNTAKGDKEGEACKKGGITVNTLPKHKTAAKHLWEFMVDAKAYGVVENVAEKSRIPKAVICIDGKKKKVSKVPFHARPLSLDELNYTLNDAIQNEFDRSIAVMAALAAVGSLRHSETVGLKLGKFMHDGLMAVTDSALDYGGFDREYYEKHDSLMLIDTAVMYINSKNVEKLPKGDKVRVAAVPECLKKIIAYAMEQRQEVYGIVGREIGSGESVYMPLINIIEGRPLVSQKLSRKWEEGF